MSEPFDRALPSPIALVRELQARAPGSVVGVAGMSELQSSAYIPTPVEDRLSELLQSEEPPHLIVVSGSAGGGKSALIARIEQRHPDLFADVVQDATHSDSPSTTQAAQLSAFFAPFADDRDEPPADGPRIVAINTGMMLALFTVLGPDSEFTLLEATLKYRMGITRERPAAAPWRLVVINLDLRPTAGGAGLFRPMLSLLDFSNPGGLLQGAPRCATCRVRAYCPVRTNSIVAARVGPAALDLLAERAAVERSRHSGPRQLYDFAARALLGNQGFDRHADPCDEVASAARAENREWVFDRLLPRALFRLGGELGERVQSLDPSLQPSHTGHGLLARAGILPGEDAKTLLELDPGGAEALATAADHLASGDAPRAATGRALIVASFLQGPDGWPVGDDVTAAYGTLLAEYDSYSRGEAGPFPNLEGLRNLLGRALARTFGLLHGATPYLPVKAYDPREPSRIFVEGTLRMEDGSYRLPPDPSRGERAAGHPADEKNGDAELAGHRPLAIRVQLKDVELLLTLPLYRLLRQAAAATLASTADLERFYGLRHAVEALARSVSGEGRQMIVERPGDNKRFAVHEGTTLSGTATVIVEELAR
jgi:hypothetical protein